MSVGLSWLSCLNRDTSACSNWPNVTHWLFLFSVSVTNYCSSLIHYLSKVLSSSSLVLIHQNPGHIHVCACSHPCLIWFFLLEPRCYYLQNFCDLLINHGRSWYHVCLELHAPGGLMSVSADQCWYFPCVSEWLSWIQSLRSVKKIFFGGICQYHLVQMPLGNSDFHSCSNNSSGLYLHFLGNEITFILCKSVHNPVTRLVWKSSLQIFPKVCVTLLSLV